MTSWQSHTCSGFTRDAVREEKVRGPPQSTTVQQSPVESTTVHHSPLESTGVHHIPPESTTVHHSPPVNRSPQQSTTVHNSPPQSTRVHHSPLESTTVHQSQPESTRVNQSPLESIWVHKINLWKLHLLYKSLPMTVTPACYHGNWETDHRSVQFGQRTSLNRFRQVCSVESGMSNRKII